jgi:two-component system sensor histidine kinase FlrB
MQMLPTSHSEPIFAAAPRILDSSAVGIHVPSAAAGLLADAFSEFIAASARLEASYRDLQGEVAQLGRELAERNVALEQSLDENRQMRCFLEQILDSMPCGVLVLSAENRVEKMNPETAALLGIEAAEASTLSEVCAITGLDLEAWCTLEGEQQFSLETDAGQRWIAIRTRKLAGSDPERGSTRTILILRDLTMQKQAEQEREASRRALSLAEIAATLAHEIRNPLASLELFGSLLAQEAAAAPSGSRTAEWIEHVRAGIRVLSGTVNNVLSFYGTGFPNLTLLAASASFERAVEFVRPIAAQAGVQLHFHSLAQDVCIRASESALGQVVLNLLCNAVRHTPKGGGITVRLEESRQGWMTMTCTDTGCGISAEDLPEIFRPGFSSGGTRSGLGLSVCRRIAAEHGGTLTASSSPGLGATFVLEIPRL